MILKNIIIKLWKNKLTYGIILYQSINKMINIQYKIDMERHSNKYQHFALDQNNNIVDIKNAIENKKYFCPSCNTEMILKRGKIRQWHFAHKADKCSYDNYLHSIAKIMVANWFNNNEHIMLKLDCDNKCSKYKQCRLYNEYICSIHINKSYDLKKYYHKCILEHKYKDFIADIYCEHHTKPIFIEINVTHECSTEKKESGIHIIELKINSEDDIMNIIKSSELVESQNIKLYNFTRQEETTYNIKQSIQKFIIYPSHKSYIDKSYNCSNYNTNRKGIYEISILYDECIPLFVEYGSFYIVGLAMAYKAGFIKKNCQLCKWQANNDFDLPICKLYKKCGNPKYCKDNRPEKCSMFKENTNIINNAVFAFKQYLKENWGEIWTKNK